MKSVFYKAQLILCDVNISEIHLLPAYWGFEHNSCKFRDCH